MKTILVDTGSTFVVNGEIYEPMYKMLEKYPNRKILLTNADDEQIASSGLLNMPYELFSLKHHPDKVEPLYFEKFLSHYNLRAEDCIYFDHIEVAVISADSIGICSYFYDPLKKDLHALEQFIKGNL